MGIAEVRVNPTGSVEVLTGSHAHGQGHETTFAQVVADRLVESDRQREHHSRDTDKVQFGMGTYGSRSGAVGISALVKALDKVESKAKKVAAQMLEGGRRRHPAQGRQVHGAGTDKSLAWGEVTLTPMWRTSSRSGAGAGAQRRRLLRSDQLHVSGRLPYLRGRGRSGDRRSRDRRLDAVDDFGTMINR